MSATLAPTNITCSFKELQGHDPNANVLYRTPEGKEVWLGTVGTVLLHFNAASPDGNNCIPMRKRLCPSAPRPHVVDVPRDAVLEIEPA